jgi:hypothetical protein
MQHKVEVKLRNCAIGTAPDVKVFFRFFDNEDSIAEVTEFLAARGFPIGFKEPDGIKFIVTHVGDMLKIPFNNYVSVVHDEDDTMHIIFFNTETFLKLYEFDKRHTELNLQNLLNHHPCARRCNNDDYSFFMLYDELASLEILRMYASTFGKAFRLTQDGYVVMTDSKETVSIAKGETVRIDADGVLSVVEAGLEPKTLTYDLISTIYADVTLCKAVAYDGTAYCRDRIVEQLRPMPAKFLTNTKGLVLNVYGNQTPVNVGDYIVVYDIGTEYSKVEVVTASDFKAAYAVLSKGEEIMADNKVKKSKKDKKVKKDKKFAKTLHNSTVSGARDNVSDLQVFGDGDTFKLICKASSQAEGWMKSTKAMEIAGVGCLVQVTTQQGKHVAEALQFIHGVRIEEINGDKKNGRRLVRDTSNNILEMLGITTASPLQDSLPAKSVAEIVDGINARHADSKVADDVARIDHSNAKLVRGVFNARRRAVYHDMIHFDGTPACAKQVVDWVNSSSDICRVVYNNGGTSHPIVMKWDGEYPATPINVGDYIVHVGNGHFQVMSEKGAHSEYALEFDGNTDPVVKEVAETAQGSAYAPLHLVDKEGNTAVAYCYDGTPACAGVIVDAARHTRCGAVCYQRGGLVVTYPTINKDDCIVARQHYVVIKGEYVYAGDQTWLSSNYSPVLS